MIIASASLPNFTADRTAGSRSLAAAAHRARSPHRRIGQGAGGLQLSVRRRHLDGARDTLPATRQETGHRRRQDLSLEPGAP